MRQGIEGPIVLTGSTPELDDFTIRIVDGASSLPSTVVTRFEPSLQVRTTKSCPMVHSRIISPTA